MCRLRETPFKGDLYFYLNENDEERLDKWECKDEDYERENRGVVFNDRKQLKAYLEGKLCPECDGYGEVQSYDPPIETHLPSTPAGTEPCHCQRVKQMKVP